MKKSVLAIGVVGALVVAWAGGTWYTGKNLEQKYAEKIERLNKEIALYLPPVDGNSLKLENVSYERGFFSSKITDKLILNTHNEQVEFTLESVLQHGPLPLARLAKLNLKPVMLVGNTQLVKSAAVEGWFKATKEQVPFSSDFAVDYSENVIANSRFSAVDLREDNIGFKMSDVVIDSDTNLKGVGKIKLNLDQISFLEKANETALNNIVLQLNGITMDIQQQQAKGFENLATGNSNLAVKEFLFDLKPGEQSYDSAMQLKISDSSINSDVQLNDGFLDILSKNQLGKLVYGDADFGEFQFNMNIKHLDAKSIDDLVALLKNMPQDGKFSAEQDEQGKQLLETLMAKNPQLLISPLAWRNEGGKSQLNLDVGFNDFNQMGDNPLSLFSKFELSSEINKKMMKVLISQAMKVNNPEMSKEELDKAIDETYQSANDNLLGDGSFADTPEAFTAKLILENGVLKHNGEAVPEEKVNEFIMSMVMAAAFYNMSDDYQYDETDGESSEGDELYQDEQLDDSSSPDEGYDLTVPNLSPSDSQHLPPVAPQQQ